MCSCPFSSMHTIINNRPEKINVNFLNDTCTRFKWTKWTNAVENCPESVETLYFCWWIWIFNCCFVDMMDGNSQPKKKLFKEEKKEQKKGKQGLRRRWFSFYGSCKCERAEWKVPRTVSHFIVLQTPMENLCSTETATQIMWRRATEKKCHAAWLYIAGMSSVVKKQQQYAYTIYA